MPTVQRAGAAQAAVTYASQTTSDPPTQAQVQAINDGLVADVGSSLHPTLERNPVEQVGRGPNHVERRCLWAGSCGVDSDV